MAVVGRSGGGKSTLLRLLAGLETPTAGDVLAGTTPLAEIQEDTRMMFQDARLLPWKSVIDNVGLGLKGQWRDAARRALAAVGLENRAGEWPAALGDVLAGTTPLAEIQEDTRMMFQDARLLPWKSVIDNVGLGLKGQWRDAARRALAAVGLENRAGEWPAALSGGQKQDSV